ncbi:collagen alpha-6(VI) chain isoform X3 [Gadus morhua]|uniref:collagen alpha-6(VI) chain isoform X3 n=1 Tax=Gadus morhua TaxID=8049 RepID=UPI0011B6E0A3|nr:collagen alpha-6(VI) chain-like isoform X3 [Gadus morhua]
MTEIRCPLLSLLVIVATVCLHGSAAQSKECTKTELADILFLVDGSTSIEERNFQSMLKFMKSIVNASTVGEKETRFGVILYSDEPKSVFTLNEYSSKGQVLEAIQALRLPTGNTYTGRALDYTLQYFEVERGGRRLSKVPQILMVITDGEATDPAELKAPAEALREKGVIVYSIGVKGANQKELGTISGNPTRVFFVDNFIDLETLSKEICIDTPPECKKQKADLVLLIDQSRSISDADYSLMKNFTISLIRSFNVSQDLVRVGVAQFDSAPQHEFYLNRFATEAEVTKHILAMVQRNGQTHIGAALKFIKGYFQKSTGSRVGAGVSQNLVLMTDGKSADDVGPPAKVLRGMGIETFVIGIGDINQQQLKEIANKPFTVENFSSLASIKTNVVKTICDSVPPGPPPTPPPSDPACSIDVAVGFDLPRPSGSQLLVAGLPLLRAALPEILRSAASIKGLCCVRHAVTPNFAFRLVGRAGQLLDDVGFEPFSEAVLEKVLKLRTSEPTYFNTALLTSFQEKFATQSKAKAKVLIVFTDGLDEDVRRLKDQSDRLRRSGVNALLAVALGGVRDSSQIQMVEFGRGFGFTVPLSVGMQSVGSTVLRQIETVADRECCDVACKCTGHEGGRGKPGTSGSKGGPGPKGHPGYPGDEGTAGDRGPLGFMGAQGSRGCQGPRGPKGNLGQSGNKGEGGDHGMDGDKGEQGTAGLAGAPGGKGDPGNAGNTGITGEGGVKGQRGLRGDPGAAGSDNSVVGPKGDPGNAGLPGDPGVEGVNGGLGIGGQEGPKGRRGPTGPPGINGEGGSRGGAGDPGASGQRGPQGVRGQPGFRGVQGPPGAQGRPGNEGPGGLVGRRGANGQKGQPGDSGPQGGAGPLGPRGIPGQDGRDGSGIPGSKGTKGHAGVHGNPGVPGTIGVKGGPAGPGPKGTPGRGGVAGHPGESGQGGGPGIPGHKGPRGPPGDRNMSECELINYIRSNCVCCQGSPCPASPTELVFGLDMSQGVTPAAFERTRGALLALLAGVDVAESNCPKGARVAVVGYSAHTKHLVRFHDYRSKKQLLELVRNIALERTSNRRRLGGAMRFVGAHVFKRVRRGLSVRKVAVFFSHGPSQDGDDIVTAVMEYRALDIVPAVLALDRCEETRKAFEADHTGSSVFLTLGHSQNLTSDLEPVKRCVICHDPCRPQAGCVSGPRAPGPRVLDVDLALVVDGSREVPAHLYSGLRELLGSVVEQVAVSVQPGQADGRARVALVQQSGRLHSQAPAAGPQAATVEFGLLSALGNSQMKSHLLERMTQKGGPSALGHTLEYALREVLLRAPNPRKHRVLLVGVGAKTSSWDQDKLRRVALEAKCRGVAVLVVALGDSYSQEQVAELASGPLKQHLLCLGGLGPEEQGYARRFIATWLSVLRDGLNTYPPASLKKSCELLHDIERRVEQVPVDPWEEQSGSSPDTTLQDQADPGWSVLSADAGLFLRATPDARCQLAQDSGSHCSHYVQRWFYDRVLGACAHFWYGGCGGNDNRFDTERECRKTCVTKIDSSLLGPSQSRTHRKASCSLGQEMGPCQDYSMYWAFDAQRRECTRFWYGGCGGNSNRFATREDCEGLCLNRRG